jgi:hypothetical protein
MSVLDFWSPALAPLLADDEPALCLSTYYTPEDSVHVGPLVCIFYAGHPEATADLRHCGGSELHPAFWSDADAAESLAEYRASAVLAGPVCTDCEVRPQLVGGRCQVCAAAELAADNYEPESEAA